MRNVAVALIVSFAVGTCFGLVGIATAVEAGSATAPGFKAPGLGDPGRLVALQISTVGQPVLDGPDARKQLLVDDKYSSGQVRDVTSTIKWQASPQNIVAISPTGLVTPLADG